MAKTKEVKKALKDKATSVFTKALAHMAGVHQISPEEKKGDESFGQISSEMEKKLGKELVKLSKKFKVHVSALSGDEHPVSMRHAEGKQKTIRTSVIWFAIGISENEDGSLVASLRQQVLRRAIKTFLV